MEERVNRLSVIAYICGSSILLEFVFVFVELNLQFNDGFEDESNRNEGVM